MKEGRRSPIFKKEEASNTIQICLYETFTCLAQDRLDLAETAKHLAQRVSELREFD